MASNFIILADDVLAVEQKITEIKKGMEYEEEPILYNLMDEGTYALVDELSTISLFETTKFIIAKNAECLLNKADKAFVELLKVMNAPSNQNILVLVFMGAIDFSSEQYQKLKRFSSVFEIRKDRKSVV